MTVQKSTRRISEEHQGDLRDQFVSPVGWEAPDNGPEEGEF